MKVYVFGNGNLSFADFMQLYQKPITKLIQQDATVSFIVCDFKGVDTLVMELLKCETAKVTVLHIGTKPRYMPDKYRTQVNNWEITGGFETDTDRDHAAIAACTHFLAFDFNSNNQRKSGTQSNIELCVELGKERVVI